MRIRQTLLVFTDRLTFQRAKGRKPQGRVWGEVGACRLWGATRLTESLALRFCSRTARENPAAVCASASLFISRVILLPPSQGFSFCLFLIFPRTMGGTACPLSIVYSWFLRGKLVAYVCVDLLLVPLPCPSDLRVPFYATAHCLGSYSLASYQQFEIRKCDASSFALLSQERKTKLPQLCFSFGYSGAFVVP